MWNTSREEFRPIALYIVRYATHTHVLVCTLANLCGANVICHKRSFCIILHTCTIQGHRPMALLHFVTVPMCLSVSWCWSSLHIPYTTQAHIKYIKLIYHIPFRPMALLHYTCVSLYLGAGAALRPPVFRFLCPWRHLASCFKHPLFPSWRCPKISQREHGFNLPISESLFFGICSAVASAFDLRIGAWNLHIALRSWTLCFKCHLPGIWQDARKSDGDGNN